MCVTKSLEQKIFVENYKLCQKSMNEKRMKNNYSYYWKWIELFISKMESLNDRKTDEVQEK